MSTTENAPGTPRASAPLARALGGEVVVDEVLSFDVPQETDRLVAVTASPVRGDAGGIEGAYTLLRNVTGRVQVEEALRQKTRELEVIFSALPDLYFRLDARGTYLDCKAGPRGDATNGATGEDRATSDIKDVEVDLR